MNKGHVYPRGGIEGAVLTVVCSSSLLLRGEDPYASTDYYAFV